MRRRIIVLAASAVVLLTGGLAVAQVAKEQGAQENHTPGLVELMMVTQTHHSKLWLAGTARNWRLADYQIDEIKEQLETVSRKVPDYKGVPVGSMIHNLMSPPIAEIERAIKARDQRKFVAAFDKLTAACNGCHTGADRGFIVIQRPGFSAFPNQSFAPKKN